MASGRLTISLALVAVVLGAPSSVRPVPISAPTALAPADLELLVAEASQRVVAIGCGAAANHGTAVAIDDGTIVTAAHVVVGAQLLNVSPRFGPTALPRARANASADLAVLDGTYPSGAVLHLAEADPAPGTAVVAAGFPGGALQLELTRTVVRDLADGSALGHRGPVLRLDVELVEGFSGGPVVDHAGNLVGLLYAVERGRGTTLALPASELRRLLAGPDSFGPAADCRRGA